MRKIFYLLAILLIASTLWYNFFEQKEGPAIEKNIVWQEGAENIEITKLGFFSNFFANTLVKLAESEKGQELVLRLVRPYNAQNSQDTLKTNSNNYLSTIFSIKNAEFDQDKPCSYCGAEVIVSYKIYSARQVLMNETDAPLHLGEGAIPALDNILAGMHEGQSRKAKILYPFAGTLKEYMTSDEEKTSGLSLEVTLHKVIGQNLNNIKIFDDSIPQNAPILCGTNIEGKIRVETLKGKTIFDRKLKYKVGDKKYPLIFSYALFNKSPSSKRSVITPAKYLKSIEPAALPELEKLANSGEEFVLIEFE